MTFQLDQIRTWPWSGSLTLVTLMTQLLIRIAIYVYNLNVSGHFFLWNRTYKIISEIDVFPPKNCCIFNYIRRSIMKDMILWLEHPKSTFPNETSSCKNWSSNWAKFIDLCDLDLQSKVMNHLFLKRASIYRYNLKISIKSLHSNWSYKMISDFLVFTQKVNPIFSETIRANFTKITTALAHDLINITTKGDVFCYWILGGDTP